MFSHLTNCFPWWRTMLKLCIQCYSRCLEWYLCVEFTGLGQNFFLPSGLSLQYRLGPAIRYSHYSQASDKRAGIRIECRRFCQACSPIGTLPGLDPRPWFFSEEYVVYPVDENYRNTIPDAEKSKRMLRFVQRIVSRYDETYFRGLKSSLSRGEKNTMSDKAERFPGT